RRCRGDRPSRRGNPRGLSAHRLGARRRSGTRTAPSRRAVAHLPGGSGTRMTAIGCGKIILLGEHAVVYGYPALAAALDRGVTIAPVPTTKGMRLDIPAWGVAAKADDDHPVAQCLCAVADALAIGRPALSLVGD